MEHEFIPVIDKNKVYSLVQSIITHHPFFNNDGYS